MEIIHFFQEYVWWKKGFLCHNLFNVQSDQPRYINYSLLSQFLIKIDPIHLKEII